MASNLSGLWKTETTIMDAEPPSTSTAAAAHTPESNAAAQAAIQAMMVQITTDGVPKLHCPVCNKALVSLNGYVKHVKKHDPPGGFLCRYCEARFCSEDELKRHREAEHTTIACRMCKETSVTFGNEAEYREHIRVVHNGIDREMFKCAKCNAEYKTIEPYRRHMETQCGTIKPHKCDQCPMAFVTKYNLKQHKEVHSGERKYCCSYCGKNFIQKGRLVEHERSHTGEKPYKCDVCGKCFAHRESIVTHSSIHTGIRLVECKCCLSRFSCYSNLIKHRRTRPDTCGLAQYDPPKNRVRTHRSRIPATLNPTSEIKVSSVNKIIKQDAKDKEQLKKLETAAKKELNGEKEKPIKPTARKRTGLGPGPGRPRRKPGPPARKKKSETDDELSSDAESDFNDANYVVNTNVESKRATRNSLIKQNGNSPTYIITTLNDDETAATTVVPATAPVNFSPTSLTTAIEERKPIWSDNSDSEEDYPDFDPADSESDNDNKPDVIFPTPKLPIKQERPDYDLLEFEDNDEHDEFEYSDASQYVDAAFNVKTEVEQNIFSEKDKLLLDCLLNDEEQVSFSSNNSNSPSKLPSFQSVKVEDECILDEAEVVLIKDENAQTQPEEEDILEVKNISDTELTKCKIMLEDITLRYPKLKGEPSIKVARNTTGFFRLSRKQQQDMRRGDRPIRKYRKRGEPKPPKENGPKRMAKISQQELKARLKMLKKEGKSWNCPYCIKIYHMRKPFEKHLRDDHKRPEQEIKETFKTEDIGIVNDEIFKCQICDKIYLVEKRLIAHVKLHGPEGNLTIKCPCYCSIYFATKEEATAHAHKEHRDLLFCELCQKFMNGHDGLRNHIKNHHTEKEWTAEVRPNAAKRNLVCDKCGKKFSGRTSLTDHVRSDCGRVPLYQCNVCGKSLTTAGILKTHMLLHKDDTPYQCDQCGKTFKVKAQYKTHIKTRHTDFKPFKCHLCPKEYPYRESLLTHMTVHTGIKRFLCNGCGKRFTCISNLQAHRKVHADTCGALPLNAKATQYMGVQKGNLLLGAKPEAGMEYNETNTLIAKEVLDRDLPMAQELNFPSEPSAPLATVPLNYAQPPPHMLLPQMVISHFIDDSHTSTSSFN